MVTFEFENEGLVEVDFACGSLLLGVESVFEVGKWQIPQRQETKSENPSKARH